MIKKRLLSLTVAVAAIIAIIGAPSAKADAVTPDNINDAINEVINDDKETTAEDTADNAEDVSSDFTEDEIFTDATVSVNMLNLRSGAGLDYTIVHVLKKGDSLRVFGKFDDWYLVQNVATGHVGCVSSYYVALKTTDNNSDNNNSVSGETEQETLLRLINEVRAQNGLAPLVMDSELSRVATHKAMDMVENNYFSHNSPTYGSPFEMMKKYGISFSKAAENLAGNQSAQGAVSSWLNSEGHLANILNADYTKTGIGIYTSPIYGKVYVQMFID